MAVAQLYLAVPAQTPILAPLVRSLYSNLGIDRGPQTPAGVYARVVQNRTLYVNTTGVAQTVALSGPHRDAISGMTFEGALELAPHDAELVE